MNEQETIELRRFADNNIQFELVKEFLLKNAASTLSDFETNVDNNILGERLRAMLTAKDLIKSGFTKLSRFKTEDRSNSSAQNVAR